MHRGAGRAVGQRGQGPPRVADDAGGAESVRVAELTLMLANRTAGLAKIECDAVAKSVSRAPTVSTRSASRARALAAGVPSRPMPPICHQARCCTAPLPAKVSSTGSPAVPASRSSSAVAPEKTTSPPAMTSGRSAAASIASTASTSLASGGGRRITQARSVKKSAG